MSERSDMVAELYRAVGGDSRDLDGVGAHAAWVRCLRLVMAWSERSQASSRELLADQADARRHGPPPRRFSLERGEDVTGVSGVGRVADGVLWPDGTVAIRWRGERPSLVHWQSLEDALIVHGHDGRTEVRWLDHQPIATDPPPVLPAATGWWEVTDQHH